MQVVTGDDTGLIKVVSLRDKRVVSKCVVGAYPAQCPSNSVSALCWAGQFSGANEHTQVDTTAEQQVAVATRSGRVQCVSVRTGRVLCQYQLDTSKSKTHISRGSVVGAAKLGDAEKIAEAAAAGVDHKILSMEHPVKGLGVLGRHSAAAGAAGAVAAVDARAFVTCLDTGKLQVLRFRPLVDDDGPDLATARASALRDFANPKAAAAAAAAAARGDDEKGADGDDDDEAPPEPDADAVENVRNAAKARIAATPAVMSAVDDESTLLPGANDIVREYDVGAGVMRMRLYDGAGAAGTGWVACGGKERLLSVWDVVGTASGGHAVWTEKNMPHDELNLRRPTWHTDIAFSHTSSHHVLATSTSHNEVRLYDTRVKRRPVLNLTGDGKVEFAQPFTSVCWTYDDNYLIAGDSTGAVRKFDVRKAVFTAGKGPATAPSPFATPTKHAGLVCGAYKGIAGAVRALATHPTLPLLTSCGLDRHVRIHHTQARTLTHKVYLRQKLNALLFSSAVADAPANGGSGGGGGDADGDDVWSELDARAAAAGSGKAAAGSSGSGKTAANTNGKAKAAAKPAAAAPATAVAAQEQQQQPPNKKKPQQPAAVAAAAGAGAGQRKAKGVKAGPARPPAAAAAAAATMNTTAAPAAAPATAVVGAKRQRNPSAAAATAVNAKKQRRAAAAHS